MIVCSCSCVNDTALVKAIKEAPILPQDPYSPEYVSSVEQVFKYVSETLMVVQDCRNCEIFIKQIIRDHLHHGVISRL